MFGVVSGNKALQAGHEEPPPGPRRGDTGDRAPGEEAVDGPEPPPSDPGREPDAGHQCALTLAALPSTPRWARALARDALRGWGMEAFADTVELLLSELVTNAVKAGGPKAVIRIVIRAAAGRVRIEVADGGFGAPHVDEPDTDTEGGRGLLLVSEISTAWGSYPVRLGSGAATGKVVWCEIAAEGYGADSGGDSGTDAAAGERARDTAEDFAEEPAGDPEAR